MKQDLEKQKQILKELRIQNELLRRQSLPKDEQQRLATKDAYEAMAEKLWQEDENNQFVGYIVIVAIGLLAAIFVTIVAYSCSR